MKKTSKVLALVLSLILCMSLMATAAFAAEAEQNGLKLTLTTDKAEYAEGEQITASLKIENTSASPVNNVTLKIDAPTGLSVATGSAGKTIATLAAGASDEVSAAYSVARIPVTGDSTKILMIGLVCMLSCIAMLALFAKRRTACMVLALFLLVSVVGVPVVANAASASLEVTAAVKVAGQDVTLKGIATYTVPGTSEQPDYPERAENVIADYERDGDIAATAGDASVIAVSSEQAHSGTHSLKIVGHDGLGWININTIFNNGISNGSNRVKFWIYMPIPEGAADTDFARLKAYGGTERARLKIVSVSTGSVFPYDPATAPDGTNAGYLELQYNVWHCVEIDLASYTASQLCFDVMEWQGIAEGATLAVYIDDAEYVAVPAVESNVIANYERDGDIASTAGDGSVIATSTDFAHSGERSLKIVGHNGLGWINVIDIFNNGNADGATKLHFWIYIPTPEGAADTDFARLKAFGGAERTRLKIVSVSTGSVFPYDPATAPDGTNAGYLELQYNMWHCVEIDLASYSANQLRFDVMEWQGIAEGATLTVYIDDAEYVN